MAIRKTRLITRNTSTSGQTFPGDIIKGEALVNLSEGILFYSGAPSSPNFTPSNYNNGYFEVGSNLYDLRVRNNATVANILTVNNLIVTGTTNLSGLTLYDETVTGTNPLEVVNVAYLSSYATSADTYVTGATYSSSTINNDDVSWTLQYKGTPSGGPYSFSGENTYTTGGTYSNSTKLITFKRNDGLTGYTVDLSTIDVNDTYVTGGTSTGATTSSPNAKIELTYNQDVSPNTYNLDYKDTFITGFTYDNANTFTIRDNSGNTFNRTFNSVTGLTINGDLTVTGNTVMSSLTGGSTTINGTLNVTGNTTLSLFTGGTGLINGDLTVTGNTNISGNTTINGTTTLNGNVSISGLSPNLVVYTDGSGNLKTETGFGYNENTDLLTVKNLTVNNTGQTANFGIGGVVIGSGGSIGPSGGTAGTGDLIVHGNLMVFGDSISAYTSNLYVEDKNITLNYNPSASTAYNSVNSGFQIQDGNGLSSGNTNFDIIRMINFTGNTGQAPETSEYTGSTGYDQRGWITQLNDIVIRSTNVVDDGITDVKGVRVLAEFDILDGGTY
jgi:hypothetical protein